MSIVLGLIYFRISISTQSPRIYVSDKTLIVPGRAQSVEQLLFSYPIPGLTRATGIDAPGLGRLFDGLLGISVKLSGTLAVLEFQLPIYIYLPLCGCDQLQPVGYQSSTSIPVMITYTQSSPAIQSP